MKKYVKNNSIVKRNIHDATYLIDITENFLDEKCRFYELNQIGSTIWDLLEDESENQAEQISQDIKKMIVDDIPLEIIMNDVSSFLLLMKEKGFIKEVDYGGA